MRKVVLLIVVFSIFGLSGVYSQIAIDTADIPTFNSAAEGDLYIDENNAYYIGQQDGSLKLIGNIERIISSDNSVNISNSNNTYDLTIAPGGTETLTNLSQNTGTGVITYTNESNTNQSANVVSTDSNNGIRVGNDGGAYKDFRALDAYNNAGNQFIPNAYVQINLDTERLNIGGFIRTPVGNVTIPEDGIYEVTYSVGFFNASATFDITDVRSELRLNNIRIDGSEIYTTHVVNPTSAQSSSRSIILQIARGDVLSIFSIIDDGAGQIFSLEDTCGISINKIN